MTRIILIGYMGAGKTTIGKALAQELGVPIMNIADNIKNQEW